MMRMETRSLQREDLIGTWHLVTLEGRSTAGDVWVPYGQKPFGMLMYDQPGNMSVVLMRPGRPAFAADDLLGGTPEEIKIAFEGFDAYCGTYTVHENQGIVTHHLVACGFPNWEGTDQVRYVTLMNDELHLSTPPILARGVVWILEANWKRAT
jgi:hypothetical protein